MRSRLLVVWYDSKKDRYYYKIVSIMNRNLKPGFVNSYGHRIVLMIPVKFKIPKPGLKERIIRYIIAFLERFI